MTQKFFQSRYIYGRLHKVETYQQHRNVLCKFLEGDTTLEDVSKTFPKVSGIETISNALRSMFKGRALTILQNMQLPRKPPARKGLLMLALNAINKSISDFLEEKLMTPGSNSTLDLYRYYLLNSVSAIKHQIHFESLIFQTESQYPWQDKFMHTKRLEHFTRTYLKLVSSMQCE